MREGGVPGRERGAHPEGAGGGFQGGPSLVPGGKQQGEDRYRCLSMVPGLKPLRALLGDPQGTRVEGPRGRSPWDMQRRLPSSAGRR